MVEFTEFQVQEEDMPGEWVTIDTVDNIEAARNSRDAHDLTNEHLYKTRILKAVCTEVT